MRYDRCPVPAGKLTISGDLAKLGDFVAPYPQGVDPDVAGGL